MQCDKFREVEKTNNHQTTTNENFDEYNIQTHIILEFLDYQSIRIQLMLSVGVNAVPYDDKIKKVCSVSVILYVLLPRRKINKVSRKICYFT